MNVDAMVSLRNNVPGSPNNKYYTLNFIGMNGLVIERALQCLPNYNKQIPANQSYS